ncbi:carbohydrate ABC transporter membrane protein 1 (CUT1 family) [Microbacterium sp. AG1240]|uniref:carbohydrate ABC transporter permease n=1 Tax=Microbacterium sp. AG1240 TaxID=2183992 RepID=UPI000EB485B1|nr:sugar ABC transporter permease [Microbacterium sp. AG1240]RKT31625.1 carbohydrate ABC transporter membrane protein 1 (CUT1 family) [Microbacterium sp. AG1240]
MTITAAPVAGSSESPPVTSAPAPRRRRRNLTPLYLALPAVGIMVVAQGYPLVTQFLMSFQEFGLRQQFGAPADWVGLSNYIAVLSDPGFWAVLWRTLLFAAVCATATMVIGVLAAILMGRVKAWVRVSLQVAMLLAWATPHLSSLTVWQWLFNTRNGVVNNALVAMGFTQFANHGWLLDPVSFFAIAAAVVIWGSVPLVMLMTYAAMTQVDTEVLEAAQLDGTTGAQRFRHVVLPWIAPMLLLVGLLQIIWDLRVFTQISVLQDGGAVASETNLLGTYIYQVGLGQGNYGSGSAIAMIMLLLTLVITFGYVRELMRRGDA